MKACPLCKSTYDDWIDFCFNDGMPLVASAAVAGATAGGGLESVLDAPDIPLSLIGAADVVEPPTPPRATPAAPPTNGGGAPLRIGAGGFDAEAADAPSAPLRIGAAGFDAAPPPGPTAAAPAPVAPAAPTAPGAVDAAALEDLAAVLGARPDAPPPVQMSVPSGFALPMADAAAPAVAAAAPSVAAAPAVPVAPRPSPVARPITGLEDAPAAGGRRLSPAAIGGLALAAVAAVGVIWLLVRPSAPPEEPPVAERPSAQRPSAPPPAVPPVAPPVVPAEPVNPPVTDAAVVPPPPSSATLPGSSASTAAAATTVSSGAASPASTGPSSSPTGRQAPTSTPPSEAPRTAVAATPPATSTPPGDGVVDAAPWGGGTAPQPSTGILKVLTDPDGATVYVDDAGRGQTPASLELAYGTHRVRVERAGYKAEAREVDIRVPELTVPFNLQPEVVTGQVNVYGPMGFRVVVDGHDMGPMPVTVQVSEGVRQFKLVGDAGQACTIPKEIAFRSPGRPETVTLQCP